ncbi:MAG: c-type cytochrome [Chlorobiaceae bacterium]
MSRTILMGFGSLCVLAVSSINALAYDATAGKTVYESSCIACHQTGLSNAPKCGDKAVWAPRIAQGIDLLVSHADKGFQGKKGLMPAKGGEAKFTTTDIGNAVTYIVEQSK